MIGEKILPIEYVVFDRATQQPMLRGTRFSIAFMAMLLRNPDWTAEQIAANYPLTLGQIHAAWSYYYDHREEIDHILLSEAELEQKIGTPLSSIPKFAKQLEHYEQIKNPKAD